jgi:hypothetical protein
VRNAHLTVLCAMLAMAACAVPGQKAAPPVQTRHFTITVTGATARPSLLTAYHGDTLVITVVADRAEEIHLHGYDRRFHPAPGKPATITFVADDDGTFEYEIENTSTHLGDLQVEPR